MSAAKHLIEELLNTDGALNKILRAGAAAYASLGEETQEAIGRLVDEAENEDYTRDDDNSPASAPPTSQMIALYKAELAKAFSHYNLADIEGILFSNSSLEITLEVEEGTATNGGVVKMSGSIVIMRDDAGKLSVENTLKIARSA